MELSKFRQFRSYINKPSFWVFLIILIFSIFITLSNIDDNIEHRLVSFLNNLFFLDEDDYLPLVFIEIDEEALSQGELWPWGLRWHAYLVKLLSEYGVKTVGYDFSVGQLYLDQESINLLVSASQETNIYYPVSISFSEEDVLKQTGISLFETLPLADKIEYKLCNFGRNNIVNYAFIENIAPSEAKFSKIPLLIRYKNEIYPAFSLALIHSYFGEALNKADITQNSIFPEELGIRLPDNFSGYIWTINDFNKSHIKIYSYFDIVISGILSAQGEVPVVNLNELKGKICLITKKGSSTSLQVANLFDAILNKEIVVKQNKFMNFGLLILTFAFLMFLFRRKNYLFRILSILIMAAFFLTYSIILLRFYIWQEQIPVFSLLIGGLVYQVLDKFEKDRAKKAKKQKVFLVKKLKENILGKSVPQIEGFRLELGSLISPNAKGDFYEFIELGDNRIGIAIGQVSGEGLDTVNFISRVIDELKAKSKLYNNPKAILQAVNNSLTLNNFFDMFALMHYLFIEKNKSDIKIVTAGCDPLLIFHSQSRHIKIIRPLNLTPLGISKNIMFIQNSLRIFRQDILLLQTGGIWEATDAQGNSFGINRIKEIILKNNTLSPQEICKNLMTQISAFTGRNLFEQDRTFIVVKRM